MKNIINFFRLLKVKRKLKRYKEAQTKLYAFLKEKRIKKNENGFSVGAFGFESDIDADYFFRLSKDVQKKQNDYLNYLPKAIKKFEI